MYIFKLFLAKKKLKSLINDVSMFVVIYIDYLPLRDSKPALRQTALGGSISQHNSFLSYSVEAHDQADAAHIIRSKTEKYARIAQF